MSGTENKIILNWIISLTIIFIAFILLVFFEYQEYQLIYGYVEDNYVSIYLTDEEIKNLNFKLKENGEIKSFEIIELSKDYILEQNKLKRNLKINFEFDRSKYILELYIEIGEKTNIWQQIYKKYMKGLM